jgi:hypothetical protein
MPYQGVSPPLYQLPHTRLYLHSHLSCSCVVIDGSHLISTRFFQLAHLAHIVELYVQSQTAVSSVASLQLYTLVERSGRRRPLEAQDWYESQGDKGCV